jgi:hypothetical protein
MLDVVARAAATLNSPEKLKQIILVNYIEGEGPKDKGYRYIPEAKLSVQLQAALSEVGFTYPRASSVGCGCAAGAPQVVDLGSVRTYVHTVRRPP